VTDFEFGLNADGSDQICGIEGCRNGWLPNAAFDGLDDRERDRLLEEVEYCGLEKLTGLDFRVIQNPRCIAWDTYSQLFIPKDDFE